MDFIEKESEDNKIIVEELDETWIKKFELEDKHYEIFYCDDLYYINVQYIYIDNHNNITNIKEEKFFMNTPNYISQEEVLGLLKKNTFFDSVKYHLMCILKFNINIEPLDVKFFLKDTNIATYNFFTPIKNIDAITFEKTITMFHDLNKLIVVYYQKSNETNHRLSNSSSIIKNMTKKISFYNKNKKLKKTIRKMV